jgi:hypothetical protein
MRRFGKKAGEIQRLREHLKAALGIIGPTLLWPIPIEFDAVLIRIAQI